MSITWFYNILSIDLYLNNTGPLKVRAVYEILVNINFLLKPTSFQLGGVKQKHDVC